MDFTLITLFCSIAVLFWFTPGADWAYAITAGIKYRSPLPAVSGLMLGHFFAVALVAVGVGAIIGQSKLAMNAIAVLGSLYLLYLGFGAIRTRAEGFGEAPELHQISSPRQIFKGFGVSGSNPKVYLIMLAVLPQFIDAQGTWPPSLQLLLLGCIHILGCFMVYSLVGFSAQRLLRSRPGAALMVTKASGAILIILGVLLLGETLLPLLGH